MALVQSIKNPFRDPNIPIQTPASTGGALNSTNTGLSSRSGDNTGPSNPTASSNTGPSSPPNPIPSDPPPAYSPGPNVRAGEASLEHGPARPFQQAPRPRSHILQWDGNLQSQYAESSRSSWSSYPGQQRQEPPPLPPRPSSDFASDFYAIGGDVSVAGLLDDQGSQSTNKPGDDGRPTAKPVPGHPLLNNGRLLVYPKGHNCPKCHNTGYKQYDPSHPCRKCWAKYGKSFTGPLAYSFSSNESSSSNTTMQKPLPKLRPPQAQTQCRPPPPPPPLPPRPSMQDGFMPGAFPTNRGSMFSMNSGGPSIRQISPWAPLPQNGPVYRPGDPRIGGRLCWRCDGDGVVSVFIFETDTCPVCNGIGRVF